MAPFCKSVKTSSGGGGTHANFSLNFFLSTEVWGQKVGEHLYQVIFLPLLRRVHEANTGEHTLPIYSFLYFLPFFFFFWVFKPFGGLVFSHCWQTKLMKTQDNRNNLVSIVPAYLETASPQRSSLRGLFTVSTTRKGKCRPRSCGSTGIFFFFNVFSLDCAGSLLLWGLFSGYGEWGLLSGCGAQGFHCRGFSCCKWRALEHTLGSGGSWVQLPPDMWDLPGQGIEPMSPALAGKFFTTEPLGKSSWFLSLCHLHNYNYFTKEVSRGPK